MWLRRLALVLGIAAVATLLASGPGTRLELWDWRTGLGLLRYAAYAGMAAAALSFLLLLMPKARKGHGLALALALVLGIAAFAPPLAFQRQARSAPPINDISTDSPSAAQREAYPDIEPVVLPLAPGEAYARALAAAQALGWEVLARDPAAGRIEAVDTTPWFGFKDDVVVRVSPDGQGSRLDIRSRSRVGRGDVGTNARRIRAWRAALLN